MQFKFLAVAAAVSLSMLSASAASAANFVTNAGFEAPSGGATSASFIAGGGVSAAPDWQLYNNTFAVTSSRVLASTAPNGEDQMLHITTGGGDNGVYQYFAGAAQYATVNVRVLSGTVALYLYLNGNQQTGSAFSGASTGWQTLSLNTGAANSNEIVIYSVSGPAEFYVDNAYASNVAPPPTGVPEPSAWALMIVGFGGAGALLRRRRAHLVA